MIKFFNDFNFIKKKDQVTCTLETHIINFTRKIPTTTQICLEVVINGTKWLKL